MPTTAELMRKPDYTETVSDLKRWLIEEVRRNPRSDDLVNRIMKSVDELAAEIKSQREEIVKLRLKAEHLITRDEVHEIAKDATAVNRERIDNLIKFVSVSHLVIGALFSFFAAKLFGK